MILLSFWETSIQYQIDKSRLFYKRWSLYTYLKKYVAGLDLAIRIGSGGGSTKRPFLFVHTLIN